MVGKHHETADRWSSASEQAGAHDRPVDTSRRSFLMGLAVGAGLTLAGCAAGEEAPSGRQSVPEGAVRGSMVPFYGSHQAGIETVPPAHLSFAAFDLTTSD